jgi:large subunit ribosomal protein L22
MSATATETATHEVRAQAKWVRSSARKARLVLEHVRGRTVPEARTVLAFSERAVARDIELVLRSAVANAEANHGLIGDELVVSAAYADEGPTLKRWRARARGRVARIRKRACHITITLAATDGATVAKPKRSDAPKTDSPKPRAERRGRQRGSEQGTGSQPRPSAENRPQPPRRTQKKGG